MTLLVPLFYILHFVTSLYYLYRLAETLTREYENFLSITLIGRIIGRKHRKNMSNADIKSDVTSARLRFVCDKL